ncbi:aggregation factor core [Yoonia sp. GPGPB17]|uniref:aggregation factor core n=1 Tax=Yoonia sp. GPGPB17 TaxID=3026147 RepID=UPI0030BB2AA5
MKSIIPSAALLALLASPALADITVRFVESAPKDRFVISSDTCPLQDVDVLIDLDGSAGGLIFDVTSAGAGVEIFQPVEVQSGIVTAQPVVDGDQQLSFQISDLRAGDDIVISADLDDVLTNSSLGQIRVAGSELDGAIVQMTIGGETQTAVFAEGANTVVLSHSCLS